MGKARDLANVGSVASQGLNFRNKIINGDFRIDQRNNGASIASGTGAINAYCLDRWSYFKQSTSGSFTLQRSTVAPPGFTNSLLVTITSAFADSGNAVNSIPQWIEGLNVADFAWGTADAQPITISFRVRSSVTGTYNVTVSNNGYDRNYCAAYTINSANTWETKTITIPGDTSGTWLTNNGVGLRLWFDIGSGSNRIGNATTWQTTEVYRTSGSVQLLNNNGATFYITGVQLEKGSSATPFEHRPYGTELALCQRYYYSYVSGTGKVIGTAHYWSAGEANVTMQIPVTMRTLPSLVSTSGTDYYIIYKSTGNDTIDGWTAQGVSTNSICIYNSGTSSGTTGTAFQCWTNNANALISFNAEL